ncbi:MAG TPA: MBL fold metallo-hydrolase [Longimicrobiales bacterium]|nr:MBL fold metallo-hydrolase [Longimicrobiales bacterium]
MRVAVLGSGSSGNATLVCAGGTFLLVDAGLSARDLARRMASLGVAPAEVQAIVITHDHGDHTRGMGVFARHHGTPLHLTERTRDACAHLLRGGEKVRLYRPGHPFSVGHVRVEPFITVHDAADPVGVALVDERTGLRMGVATDLGRPTAQIRHALSGCDLLVLEANHDELLLASSPYPWSVKRRIASSHGHLSNHDAARFAVELLHPHLAAVVLAHLSDACNRPELALQVVGDALRHAGWKGHLEAAAQDRPTGWLDVEELRSREGPGQLTLL